MVIAWLRCIRASVVIFAWSTGLSKQWSLIALLWLTRDMNFGT
jgi:hypothetical protein